MSKLIEMLGSEHPVIQGPVGAINDPDFVAAVCEAGGFGMLALGFTQGVDDAARLIDAVRDKTEKPFGANLMIINPMNEKLIPLLSDAGVKTVTTSVGSPAAIYPHLHELGMKGLHVVLSLKHAVRAVEAGADGLVLAGSEAGGLRSTGSESSTLVLVPLVADQVSVPLVAAGGIADSRGYRAAIALGAQGVQLGTRLLASVESPVHEKWKEQIVNSTDGETDLLPVDNMMMRAIITPELRARIESPGFDMKKEFQLKNASKAWNSADFDLVPAGAGQTAALINDIISVKDIIEKMVSGG